MSKRVEDRLERLEDKVDQLLKTGTTHVAVIQDKSSSMTGREPDVINGFNEYLQELQSSEEADKMRLTLTQFDTQHTEIHKGRKLSAVSKMEDADYRPSGMTALYDAIGRTINIIRGDMKGNDKALVVVMTDGAENSSREFNQHQITSLIEKCQDENWTFVYLGADIDAFRGGTSIGIHGGNTMRFDGHQHQRMYRNLATASGSYASSSLSSTPTFTEDFLEPAQTVTTDSTGVDPKTTTDAEDKENIWTPGKSS